MEDAINISKYIISALPVNNLKLQKLLFYTQAVSLYRSGGPAFPERIEAWDYGPVVPNVYHKYKGWGFETIQPAAQEERTPLSPDIMAPIDLVLEHYGDMTPGALIHETHSEAPWQDAYEKGRNTPITNESIKAYYDTVYTIK